MVAADDAKVREEKAYREKMAAQKKALQEAFMSREIHPDVAQRINDAVKRAAEQGHSQFQVLTFPSSYTNDRAAASTTSIRMAAIARRLRQEGLRVTTRRS